MAMIKVGIDAHGVGGHSLGHGNETYFRNLIGALLEIDSRNEYHVFANHPEAMSDVVSGHANARLVALRPRSQWLQRPFSLPWYAARHGLDIIHVPFVLPPVTTARTVVTVHDICFEEYPQFFRTVERMRMHALVPRSCRRANVVLTVSEFARDQILRLYGIPPGKVRVTYNAASHTAPRDGACPPRPARLAGRPYVLYLGLLEPRKNLVRLVRAFELLKVRGLPHVLVLAGTQGWRNEALLRTIAASRYRSDIVLPGYVPRADLPSWLAHASVFAFPSTFEGFGIPPMEAQQWGIPAVVSDTTCFPEIYEDSVTYCDPSREETIADALQRTLSDEPLRERLRQAGLRNSRRFSWRTTADLTLKAYQHASKATRQ